MKLLIQMIYNLAIKNIRDHLEQKLVQKVMVKLF